eukprot:4628458-Amphidinium_carterae.1
MIADSPRKHEVVRSLPIGGCLWATARKSSKEAARQTKTVAQGINVIDTDCEPHYKPPGRRPFTHRKEELIMRPWPRTCVEECVVLDFGQHVD